MNTIGIIGLGYVGLPLAVAFGEKIKTIGFDLNSNRIRQLKLSNDITFEVSKKEIIRSKYLNFTSDVNNLKKCNYFIIAVPTPVNKRKKPDLRSLKHASKIVSKLIKKKDIVIYESTVFPGTTEDICVPILEKFSKLIYNKDFFCGYSPERINPGDKNHKLSNTCKITSGSNPRIANIIDKLYKKIIKAGTYKASSIKIAEAAKIIENCQRDINISFVNELSLIFHRLNLDTSEILKAAATKWNFINFSPGLVGGHCISVDPYYLSYLAQQIGYHPKILLNGRKLNDNMGIYIAKKILSNLKTHIKNKKNFKVLVMGITFKENCSDYRNTKVIDIINYLNKKNIKVDIYDPIVHKRNILIEYNIKLLNYPRKNYYDCIVIAVPHKKFFSIGIKKIKEFGKINSLLFDLKSIFPKKYSNFRL